MHRISMLGTGLIGRFYTKALHGNRSRDRVELLYSRSAERAREAAASWGVSRWTDDLAKAIEDPDTDVVVVGLPNFLHKEAVLAAARVGKAVLCTKPLAANGRRTRWRCWRPWRKPGSSTATSRTWCTLPRC